MRPRGLLHWLGLFSGLFVAACASGGFNDELPVGATPGSATASIVTDTTIDVSSFSHGNTTVATGTAVRPVTMHVPPSYEAGHPLPLVILLHGYGASGADEEAYMHLTAEADARGFLYAYPNGTTDLAGNRFWNATTACCNFFDAHVDDSAYLADVIRTIEARFDVARRRVFIVGHSNGAFMAYRMACDHADLVAGIVSLAGSTWEDAKMCAPSEPVSVLEIHGTHDTLVPFDGGELDGRPFPAVKVALDDWIKRDHCTTEKSGPRLDLEVTLPGLDTTTRRFGSCEGGASVELWTIVGGGHIPELTNDFARDVVTHLLDGTP